MFQLSHNDAKCVPQNLSYQLKLPIYIVVFMEKHLNLWDSYNILNINNFVVNQDIFSLQY